MSRIIFNPAPTIPGAVCADGYRACERWLRTA